MYRYILIFPELHFPLWDLFVWIVQLWKVAVQRCCLVMTHPHCSSVPHYCISLPKLFLLFQWIYLQKYFRPWLRICSDLYCPVKVSLYHCTEYLLKYLDFTRRCMISDPRLASLSYISGDVHSDYVSGCAYMQWSGLMSDMATDRWSE